MYAIPFLDLPALKSAQGRVRLPGSKSISNRVLLLAALCDEPTLIHDLLDSDDTRVMLTALQQLGCTIERQGEHSVRLQGWGAHGPRTSDTPTDIFLGNAGTAMRPLTAALAVLGAHATLRGIPRMHERPIGDLVDGLRQWGCDVRYTGQDGYPPLAIGAPALNAQGAISVRGDVSSQFLTAMLLAAPLVAERVQHDVVIDVAGELISKPYIGITLNLMRQFGVTVQQDGWQRFTIGAGSRYRSPGVMHVESDASSASYFIALGALAAPPGEAVFIDGLGESSIQGDIRFIDAARAMGAQIDSGPNWLRIARPADGVLRGIDLDCNAIPDAAMTLAVMALYADAPTTLRNIASWRVKETDRIAAMACELRKLGATVEEGADFIRIDPLPAGRWRAARIHTYDDHRMAMCLSLAAFNPDGVPVRIEDPQCVAKTFPDYFETLFTLVQSRAGVPVLCVDGPTASGKGTLASRVAAQLGYHYLDSGALYRLTGVAARRAELTFAINNIAPFAQLARELPVRFVGDRVYLGDDDVSDAIRTEAAGMDASFVSAMPEVREALVERQRAFAQVPGLVADGRDMGTVIFPDAPLKVYLTASAAQRAERRHKQLIEKGQSVTLDSLRADLEARDARDMSRATAPLKPAEDALLLDNSAQTIDQSVTQVLAWWQARQPFKPA